MDDDAYTDLTPIADQALTLESLGASLRAWRAMRPWVCCVACRQEGSDFETDTHWLRFESEGVVYHLAQCLIPDPLARMGEPLPVQVRRRGWTW
jgi:hypothetical protein